MIVKETAGSASCQSVSINHSFLILHIHAYAFAKCIVSSTTSPLRGKSYRFRDGIRSTFYLINCAMMPIKSFKHSVDDLEVFIINMYRCRGVRWNFADFFVPAN